MPSMESVIAAGTRPAGTGDERLSSAAAGDLPALIVAWRWVLLCLGATFLIYLACIPRILLYSNPPTGDQPFYLMDAISIVQDGDLNLANNYARHDFDTFYQRAPHPPGFVGIRAPYPLPPQLAVTPARPPGEEYSYHLPGLGLALAPVWLIGSWFSLWWPATIVFMCLVGALVALNVFLLAYEVSGRLPAAWMVWAAMAFSGPIMSYSLLIFTELPCGLLLIYAFRRLALGWRANGPLRRLLIGLCIGYIPWLAWRCLPISLALGAYALVQWRRAGAGRETPGLRERLRRMAPEVTPLTVPIVISVVALVWYSYYLFGQPYPSGVLAGQGTPVFHWPWRGGHDLILFVTGAFAILFDRQWGLLPFTPVYLLGAVGIIRMYGSARSADRRLLFWSALVTVPYALMIASFDYWGGLWCPPARYLTTLVPLLAAPLAVTLARNNTLYRVIFGVLALIGFAFMALMVRNPHLMFPVDRAYLLHWLAADPQSPLHVNLLPFIPAYAWPDPVAQPVMTARIVAVALAIILGCRILLAPRRDHLAARLGTSAPGWLSAAAIIGSGWFVMNYDFLQHKTLLVQQYRWTLQPAPRQPEGAAFAGGKVYLTDYSGRSVGVLDVNTGLYGPMALRTSRGPLPLAHPADIILGPGHLLYLLNNGRGANALYVMTPSGRVVRRERLAGKQPISLGMAFGRRSLYVADVLAGVIREYGPGGGRQRAAWSGMTRGFNNVTGIAVGPGGVIYAAESSANRVQALSPGGRFLRSYDLGCSPQQVVSRGRWIDVSCTTRLVSIDTRGGAVQQSEVGANDPPLSMPSGLAYGPNGILYVVDGDAVVSYRVEH